MTSTHKTNIDIEYVTEILKDDYGQIKNLVKISGGESSQAFGFEFKEKELVIRLNKHGDENFKIDKYAYENFKNTPIPRIFKIDKTNDDIFYCISEKVEGEVMATIKGVEFEKVLPDLFNVLSRIHEQDISNTVGYGKFILSGDSTVDSWKSFLLEDNFMYKGEDLADVYNQFLELIKFCPEDRYLVHGDYSGSNVLSKDGMITGVLDWEQARYGDFLYDVAWMNFWRQDFDYVKYYFEKYKNTGKNLENFKERILCYQFKFGLESLSFYVYSNQTDKFNSTKNKLLNLL